MTWFKFWENKKVENNEQTALQLASEHLKKQNELGDKLFSLLVPAAEENKIFNLSKDSKPYSIGPIKISKIPKNGNAYSIFALIKDSYKDLVIFQVTINVAENNIHVLLGPYGPETNFKLEDYDTIAMNLLTYVKEFAYYQIEPTTALRKRLFGV